jgi:hypothetical protein
MTVNQEHFSGNKKVNIIACIGTGEGVRNSFCVEVVRLLENLFLCFVFPLIQYCFNHVCQN